MSQEVQELARLALAAAGNDRSVAAARLRLRTSQYRMYANAAAADGRDGAAQVYNDAADAREAAAASLEA